MYTSPSLFPRSDTTLQHTISLAVCVSSVEYARVQLMCVEDSPLLLFHLGCDLQQRFRQEAWGTRTLKFFHQSTPHLSDLQTQSVMNLEKKRQPFVSLIYIYILLYIFCLNQNRTANLKILTKWRYVYINLKSYIL